VFKGLLYEGMNVIGWCYAMKGPNLHVEQAHFDKNLVVLHLAIYRSNHLIRQLKKKNLKTYQHANSNSAPHIH
jgi:hypothetical protein